MFGIIISPIELPIYSPLQVSPDIMILSSLFVIGLFEFCCLSCSLIGHYFVKRNQFTKMAKRRGVGLTGPPKRSTCPYQILGVIVLFGPAALIMSSLASGNTQSLTNITYGAVWFYALFWAIGVPIVMIYAHFSQMRDWKNILIARGIYRLGDTSEPEYYQLDYEHFERLGADDSSETTE